MFKTFAASLVAAFAAADNVHDDMKVAGIVEGFFVGAFDFHGMTDIGHCISDANPVEQHFENAMRGFWNGSYQEVTKAIDQLGLAVSDIGDMLDHCGKIDHHDYEQIQRMAEAFLHPKQLLLEATESLIVNGVNIFEDTREGLHDYRMGHWLDAGEHFGQAAAMLLYGKTQMVDHEELFYDFDNHWQELLDQIDHEKDEKMHHFEAMKSSNVHFTFFRMGKILEGLLAGSVEAEVPHGVECLRDAKHIWERFGGVIDQLQHATFNSVLHAVEDLGHVIHDIANELEECKATVGTDLDKLREMSKAFTDPWYFIFHIEHDLIVNGQDIHHEVMDAEAQWENQHFYEFGHSVGLALSKIFLGGQMKNDIPLNALPKKAPAKKAAKKEHEKDDVLLSHTSHHYVPAHHTTTTTHAYIPTHDYGHAYHHGDAYLHGDAYSYGLHPADAYALHHHGAYDSHGVAFQHTTEHYVDPVHHETFVNPEHHESLHETVHEIPVRHDVVVPIHQEVVHEVPVQHDVVHQIPVEHDVVHEVPIVHDVVHEVPVRHEIVHEVPVRHDIYEQVPAPIVHEEPLVIHSAPHYVDHYATTTHETHLSEEAPLIEVHDPVVHSTTYVDHDAYGLGHGHYYGGHHGEWSHHHGHGHHYPYYGYHYSSPATTHHASTTYYSHFDQ